MTWTAYSLQMMYFLNNNLCLLRVIYLTAPYEFLLVVMYTLKSGVNRVVGQYFGG